MAVSGLLTCSMFLGLFDPARSLEMNFGAATTNEPATQIVTRNWSALIGISGIMLIYGAFVPSLRKFVLLIASLSKIIFIILVVSYLPNFMNYSAGVAVIADSIMIIFFAAYIAFHHEKVP